MTSHSRKRSVHSNGLLGLATVAAFMVALSPRFAHAFQAGDVFVSVSNGLVMEFTPAGALVRTLNTNQGGFTTGSAFDSSGNFYVTDFSVDKVSKFDPDGNLLGTFGSGYSTPESILFDAAGNVYVGNLGGFIRKLDSAGNSLSTFNTGRTDWMDLSSDQCVMLRDTEGGAIHRFDVCANQALSDFSTVAGDFAMRILPTGGVLVADEAEIHRLDASGNIVQTYDVAGEDTWFALNLDPDGKTFWSANFGSANVYRFDINTGAVVSHFNTGTGGETVFGVSVKGEITVSSPPPTPTPPACALTAVIAGPPKQLQITIQDPDNGLASVQVTESNNADVSVPNFAVGEKGALVVTATKIDQSTGAQVALHLTDVNGATTDCDPVVPGEQPDLDVPAHAAAAGCSVGRSDGTTGLPCMLGAFAAMGLALRRRRAASKTGR